MAISVTNIGTSSAITATGTQTLTGVTVPAGSTIVCAAWDNASITTAGTLADTASNSYSSGITLTASFCAGKYFYVVNCAALSGGTITYTRVASTALGRSMSAFYITGVSGLDSAVTATLLNQTSNTNPLAGTLTSGTPTQAGDLFCAMFFGSPDNNGGFIEDSGHGWAPPLTNVIDAFSAAEIGGGNQVNAGSGTKVFAPGWDVAQGNAYYALAIIGFAPSTNVVSAALTQVASATALGSLKASTSKALTQLSSTGATGTVTPGISEALTQIASAGATGTLAPVTSKVLSEVASTGATGTLTPTNSLPISGVSATGQLGTLTPGISRALTQIATAGALGTLSLAASVGLTEVASAGALGTLSVVTTVALTQIASVGATGVVTVPGSVVVGLTQVASTGVLGALTPGVSKALAQVASVGATGTLIPSVSRVLSQIASIVIPGVLLPQLTVSLSGVAAVGAVGTLTPALLRPLAGVQSVSVIGQIAVTTTTALTGVSSAGVLGVVVAGGVVVRLVSNPRFWARAPSIRRVASPRIVSNRIISAPSLNRVVTWRASTVVQAAQLTEIDVGEKITVTFDFAGVIKQGETLSGTPTIICTNATSTLVQDPTPAVRLIGAAVIGPSPTTGAANTAVLQQIGTMVADVVYVLQCIATDTPDTPSLWARIPCIQPS